MTATFARCTGCGGRVHANGLAIHHRRNGQHCPNQPVPPQWTPRPIDVHRHFERIAAELLYDAHERGLDALAVRDGPHMVLTLPALMTIRQQLLELHLRLRLVQLRQRKPLDLLTRVEAALKLASFPRR